MIEYSLPLERVPFPQANFIQLHSIEQPIDQLLNSISLPLKPLTNAYTGTIVIDQREIKCIFDTGSTNTWIYDDNLSSFKSNDYSCSIQFGSGKLEGTFGHADIKVANLLLPNQCFGRVKKTEVFDSDFSCIVGLAYPGMKAGKDWHIPFFDSLMATHGINTFAFNFSDRPSLEFNPVIA